MAWRYADLDPADRVTEIAGAGSGTQVSSQDVLAYTNPAVVRRIAKDECLTEEEAGRAFSGMLQFLYVTATVTGRGGPPYYIDAAWHAFILHTRDYAEFCDRYFGRFLHHQPLDASEGTEDSSAEARAVAGNASYAQIRAAAAARFELDETIWPDPSPLRSDSYDPREPTSKAELS